MSERTSLIKKLDDVVREIVLLRDSECITCGSRQNLTAGHYLRRRHLTVRWDLLNVHAQCWECNSGDDFGRYVAAMLGRFDADKIEELVARSRVDYKFTNAELQDMLVELKSHLKQLQNKA